MKIYYLIAVLLLFPIANTFAQKQLITSIYTDLTVEKCKTLEQHDDEAGYYLGECKGVGGYKLESIEGDLRQTINVIAPGKKKFELNFGNVSSAFSAIGNKAEWRVTTKKGKVTPLALIVRFNASEYPENPSQTNSYLIVSKITADDVCITNVVKSKSANANADARKLADQAADQPCKVFAN